MDKQTTKLEHLTALSDQTLEQIQGGGGWWDWFPSPRKKDNTAPQPTLPPHIKLG